MSLTKPSLHRVYDVREAVCIQRIGLQAAVKPRVDPQHGVVQNLEVQRVGYTSNLSDLPTHLFGKRTHTHTHACMQEGMATHL